MKLRDRRVGLLVLTVMLFVSLAAAQTPLQPLVMRSNEQRGVEPAECAEGLDTAPVPPRITVRDLPVPDPDPEDVPPPPSSALRGNFEELQRALVRNDRPAFDESLARVRALVESYPRGGERSAAEDVLRVYSDAARLWEAQYTSPFFVEGSPEYAAVSAYPGYGEAIRRATFTDAGGNRFYPAAESRVFLANVAAQRLQRLGVRAAAVPPSRVTRTDETPRSIASMTPPRTNRDTATRDTSTRDTSTRGTSTRDTTTRGTSASPRTTTNRGTAITRSAPRSTRGTTSGSTTTRKPAAATIAPSTPNPSASPTATAGDVPDSDTPPADVDEPATATSADPATETSTDTASDTATDTSDTDAGDTDTALTGTTPLTDTAGTALDTTATTAPAAETTPAPKRPVFLATILILIGLGVLIVLFRAAR